MKSKNCLLAVALSAFTAFVLSSVLFNLSYFSLKYGYKELRTKEVPFFVRMPLEVDSAVCAMEVTKGAVTYCIPFAVLQIEEGDDFKNTYEGELFTMVLPTIYDEHNIYDDSKSYFSIGKEFYLLDNMPEMNLFDLLFSNASEKHEYYRKQRNGLRLRGLIESTYQYDSPRWRVVSVTYEEPKRIQLFIFDPASRYRSIGEIGLKPNGKDADGLKQMSEQIIRGLRIRSDLLQKPGPISP